MIGMFHHFWHM